jgi:hypothetical protein
MVCCLGVLPWMHLCAVCWHMLKTLSVFMVPAAVAAGAGAGAAAGAGGPDEDTAAAE